MMDTEQIKKREEKQLKKLAAKQQVKEEKKELKSWNKFIKWARVKGALIEE